MQCYAYYSILQKAKNLDRSCEGGQLWIAVTFSEYIEGALMGLMTTMLSPAYVWMRFPP